MLLHKIAKEMKKLGNEVSAIISTSRYRTDWLRLSTFLCEKEQAYEYDGIGIFQLGFSKLTRAKMIPWALSYYAWMNASVREIAGYIEDSFEQLPFVPSIIHATRNGREFIFRAAINYARRHKIPFVLTPVHHPRWKGTLYREYKKIYQEADAILALTSSEKEILIQQFGVSEQKIYLVGAGPFLTENYSAEEFRTKYSLNAKFVLFLGQQFKYKGIEDILKAASIVWRKNADTRFVFIGPYTRYSRNLFRHIKDPRIINLGAVSLEDKTSALAACEFLCLPSTQESFGIVFTEAWSFQKPVIGGRINSIECVIDHNRDGLISSPNPEDLAAAMSFLLNDTGKCQEMGYAGWLKVQEKYSWGGLSQKIFEIYTSLL